MTTTEDSIRSYAQSCQGLISQLLASRRDPDTRLLIQVTIACELMDGFDRLRRLPSIPRPATLPIEDVGVWKLLRDSRKRMPPQHAKQAAREFGEWAYAVMRQEARSQRNVEKLFFILDTFRATGDEGFFEHCLVVAHLLAFDYNLHVPPLPEREEWARVAARAVREEDLVSSWLLARDDPPRWFVPPGEEREEESDGG